MFHLHKKDSRAGNDDMYTTYRILQRLLIALSFFRFFSFIFLERGGRGKSLTPPWIPHCLKAIQYIKRKEYLTLVHPLSFIILWFFQELEYSCWVWDPHAVNPIQLFILITNPFSTYQIAYIFYILSWEGMQSNLDRKEFIAYTPLLLIVYYFTLPNHRSSLPFFLWGWWWSIFSFLCSVLYGHTVG